MIWKPSFEDSRWLKEYGGPQVLNAKISDNAPLTKLGQSSESKVGLGLDQDFECRPP